MLICSAVKHSIRMERNSNFQTFPGFQGPLKVNRISTQLDISMTQKSQLSLWKQKSKKWRIIRPTCQNCVRVVGGVH